MNTNTHNNATNDMPRHSITVRLGLLLGLVCLPLLAVGQTTDTADLWQRLRPKVAEQNSQMQRILASQRRLDASERELQQQLQHSRELRAMQREALLLSQLNVAWVHDQLAHWDCHMAAHKRQAIQRRLQALQAFGQRVDTLCLDLSPTATAQRRVCTDQRRQLATSIAALQRLLQRNDSACAAPAARQQGPAAGTAPAQGQAMPEVSTPNRSPLSTQTQSAFTQPALTPPAPTQPPYTPSDGASPRTIPVPEATQP